MDEDWAKMGRLIVLEPRRLAARMAARHMAAGLGEAVGERIGYRVRLDAKAGARTRVEFNTDGVFLRRLQQDPELNGVAAVLFDEVHERGLESDLALALCREAQQALRPDLRLIAMSATLDAAPIARLLGDCPVLTGEGRSYPVETRWRPMAPHLRLPQAVAEATRAALSETEGDMLVFLPGQADIRRTAALLGESALPPHVDIRALYGELTGPEQDAALEPSPPGRRKIVLATSIAESSLTIQGVRVVVDSGYMRQPLFSPRTGMSGLETIRVSQASAEQRRGRAGRLAPGICYRLWAEAAHGGLAKFTAPEILQADLAPLALDLAQWGAKDEIGRAHV
jgi:ATP-dependent helicase HrpB